MRLVLSSALLIALAQPSPAAGPVCALLDPEKAPRAALVEAKLIADPGTTWVERADVDAVLREQKLQALFGPRGVGDRVKLGRLLKADVLVMVRPVKGAAEPALEVVVSETAGGLRLLHRAVPVTKDADADVAALLAAARDGIKKHGEAITGIVAVPPFVSNDLGYDLDHLKGAYAKLAESVALDRKGVVVVELEEAQVLAKELALGAPGAKVDRPAPLYLLGEYRHDGTGAERTASLKLRAERGGMPVGKPAELRLKPDEAASAVRAWTAGSLTAGALPPADPKREAAVLAARARTFETLGNWAEALALIEASLLLDSDQPALRVAALRSLTPLVKRAWPALGLTLEEARRARPLYLRGLAHLERLTADDDLRHYRAPNAADAAVRFVLAPNGLLSGPRAEPATNDILAELQQARRELFVPLVPRFARHNITENVAVGWAVAGLPPKEKYELVERLVLQVQDLRNTKSRVTAYAKATQPYVFPNLKPPVGEAEEAEYRALLARLAAAKNSDVRAAATDLLAGWNDELAAKGAPKPVAPKATTAGGVTFRPAEHALPVRTANALDGITAAGTDVDVLWSAEHLWVMKAKGACRPVWSGEDSGTRFNKVVYDGRYVWATAIRFKKWPLLVVLDPVSEKAWEVTAAAGLPQGTDEQLKDAAVFALEIAPLGPGAICAAGSFGRAWVARVTFDAAAGKPAVNVFHEAREGQDANSKEQGGRTTAEFSPNYMLSLVGPVEPGGKPTCRVVLGRGRPATGISNPDVLARPLAIDADRPTVGVLRERVEPYPHGGLTPYPAAEVGDAAYLLSWDTTKSAKPSLVRIGLPDLKATTVIAALPEGCEEVLVHANRLHIIRRVPVRLKVGETGSPDKAPREWWAAELDGKDLRLVADGVPDIRAVGKSSHYGLVCACVPEGGKVRTLHTIEFPAPKPKK